MNTMKHLPTVIIAIVAMHLCCVILVLKQIYMYILWVLDKQQYSQRYCVDLALVFGKSMAREFQENLIFHYSQSKATVALLSFLVQILAHMMELHTADKTGAEYSLVRQMAHSTLCTVRNWHQRADRLCE